MKMPEKNNYINIDEIYFLLHNAGYMHNDKTIIKRTVRTMIDKGLFKSAKKSGYDRRWIVLKREVIEMSEAD